MGGANFNREGVNLGLGKEEVIGLSRGVGGGGTIIHKHLFCSFMLCIYSSTQEEGAASLTKIIF